jgi:hypothetical protein
MEKSFQFVDGIDIDNIARKSIGSHVMKGKNAGRIHPSVIEAQSHHWATWDTVPTPTDVRPITSKLVFKRKYGPDGQVFRHKARLVAGGFQQAEGIDYEGTFAAVVKPASYRILFAIAAIYSWLIHQADVKTAFLNGALPKRVRNL